MKKLLLITTLLTASLAAWAQGRVRFWNDSLHLVYFTTDTSMLSPGEAELAGTPYDGQTLANGVTLVADLYAGTSPSSLMSVATASFLSGAPGQWAGTNLTLPWTGGTTAYFQVQVHAANDPYGAGYHLGDSSIFT